MPDMSVVEQQRIILCSFRTADAERGDIEADAEKRQLADHQAADAAINRVRQESESRHRSAKKETEARRKAAVDTADRTLAHVRGNATTEAYFVQEALQSGLGTPRSHLHAVGLAALLDSKAIPISVHSNDDAKAELSRRASVVRAVTADIASASGDLSKKRHDAGQRRRRIIVATIGLMLIAAVGTGTTFAIQRESHVGQIATDTAKPPAALGIEQLYQSAVNAINAGQWQTAADAIYSVSQQNASYKDIANLVVSKTELRDALVRRPYQTGTRVVLSMSPSESITVNNIAFVAASRSRDTCTTRGYVFEMSAANKATTSQAIALKVDAVGQVYGGNPPQDGCYSNIFNSDAITLSGGQSVSYGFRDLGSSGPTRVIVTMGSLIVQWNLR